MKSCKNSRFLECRMIGIHAGLSSDGVTARNPHTGIQCPLTVCRHPEKDIRNEQSDLNRCDTFSAAEVIAKEKFIIF